MATPSCQASVWGGHEQDALAVEVLRRDAPRCWVLLILLLLERAEVLEVLQQLQHQHLLL